jgi:hypothetical protein
LCFYRSIAELSEAVEAHSNILRQLLPAVDYSALSDQTKQDIERLTGESHSGPTLSTPDSQDIDQFRADHPDFLSAQGTPDHEWREVYGDEHTAVPVGDDTNGLSSASPNRSYIGLSSPGAALRVLFAISPEVKSECDRLERINSVEAKSSGAAAHAVNARESLSPSGATPMPPLEHQTMAIEAYFSTIHPYVPMIDECWFRTQFEMQTQTDSSCVALTNVVLALGSAVAGDDDCHLVYHQQVRKALGYDIFCSGNLEMLQALILLGGLYLNYTNSPNSAYMIRGTALRMAIAMGLHRESVISAQNGFDPKSAAQQGSGVVPRAELLRRTWWCLINSDVLGGLVW